MWRDRTNLYLSYRQSYAHHPTKKQRHYASGLSANAAAGGSASDEDRRGLLSADPFYDSLGGDDSANGGNSGGDAVIEMDLLPPRWADVTDEVTELLGQVARQGQQLDRLHQQHVLPGFNEDVAAKRAEEAEIERLTQAITRGFHDCHRCIQRVEQMVREGTAQGTMSRADKTMAKNVQMSLAARVQEASAGFRKKQSAYLKKLKGMSAPPPGLGGSPAPGSSSASTNYAADPSLQESDADRSFSQWALQTTEHQKQLHANDALIVQRERAIEDIAQGIIDLSDLFRDLQTMVIDQGTVLDRIDYNVERMATDVKAAHRELVVASGYQRKTTKRKIILLLVLLVVGLFILVLIKPKKHRSAGGGGGRSSSDSAGSGGRTPGNDGASSGEAAAQAVRLARSLLL